MVKRLPSWLSPPTDLLNVRQVGDALLKLSVDQPVLTEIFIKYGELVGQPATQSKNVTTVARWEVSLAGWLSFFRSEQLQRLENDAVVSLEAVE